MSGRPQRVAMPRGGSVELTFPPDETRGRPRERRRPEPIDPVEERNARRANEYRREAQQDVRQASRAVFQAAAEYRKASLERQDAARDYKKAKKDLKEAKKVTQAATIALAAVQQQIADAQWQQDDYRQKANRRQQEMAEGDDRYSRAKDARQKIHDAAGRAVQTGVADMPASFYADYTAQQGHAGRDRPDRRDAQDVWVSIDQDAKIGYLGDSTRPRRY